MNHNFTCRVTSHSMVNGSEDELDRVYVSTDGDFGSIIFTTSLESASANYPVGTSLLVQVEPVPKEEPERRPMDEYFREIEDGATANEEQS